MSNNDTPTGTHCCDRMLVELGRGCEHTTRYECPDALVEYLSNFDEYGIIVHDGGSSIVQIIYCPWCAAKLPESKRDRWFDELEARGIDPLSDEVPPQFRDASWWKQQR